MFSSATRVQCTPSTFNFEVHELVLNCSVRCQSAVNRIIQIFDFCRELKTVFYFILYTGSCTRIHKAIYVLSCFSRTPCPLMVSSSGLPRFPHKQIEASGGRVAFQQWSCYCSPPCLSSNLQYHVVLGSVLWVLLYGSVRGT